MNIAPIVGLWLYDWARDRKGKGNRKKPTKISGRIPDHILNRPRIKLKEIALVGISRDLPELADIAAALAVIPNPDLGWDDWNRVGMAIWASVDGDPIGAEMFDRWSQKSKKYEEGAAQERWQKYAGSPPTELSFGTLVYMAREAQPGYINGQPALPPQLNAATPSNPLIELNDRYSVVGNVGGKCLVLSWINSAVDALVKMPSLQTFQSFKDHYSNQYIRVGGQSKALGKYWLGWTGRKTYEGIDLVPNSEPLLPGNVLNLWRGFAVEPQPGDWSLMQWHICHILADGDVKAAEYIFKWCAWAVQHPDDRAEVALVLRGGKGAGKGTFGSAMRALFGHHGLHIYTSRHLTGNFNAHLRSCILLFADEAFWAGDKQGESTLKALLTERTLIIEQKGVDAVMWKNRLHMIIGANADWAVPASHDERRFQVFDINESKINDLLYFERLWAQLNNGGMEAMLHDLLRVDLRGWHPRQIVPTRALQKQKELSLVPLAAWWEELLQDGVLPFHAPGAPKEAWAEDILEHVKGCRIDTRHGGNQQALGRFLRAIASQKHDRKGNLWLFPELNDARAAWEKKMRGWTWHDETALKWLDRLGNRPNPSQPSPILHT